MSRPPARPPARPPPASSKQAQNTESKTALTLQTLRKLKMSTPAWQEYVKACQKYKAAMEAMAQAGIAMSDALSKVAEGHQGDLGVGLKQISDIHKTVEQKRLSVAASLETDIIVPISRSLDPDRKEVVQFEKDYLKLREKHLSDLKTAEAQSKRAGKDKKRPDALQQAIQAVSQRVKAMDEFRMNKLREALMLERRKFCFMLMHQSTVVNAELALYNEAWEKLNEQIGAWYELGTQRDALPADVEQMIKAAPNRTFVAIQPEADGGGGQDFSTMYEAEDTSAGWGATSGEDSGWQDSGGGGDYGGGGGGDVICRVRVLYEYAATRPDELNLAVGDEISVTAEGSDGWMHGYNDATGASGAFPANFVTKDW